MRDAALVITLLGIIPLILYRPHAGVLAWAWLALMNPHRESYSFQDSNLNFLIACLTFTALVFSGKKPFTKLNGTLIVIIMFALWTTVTTFAALNYDLSFDYWHQTIKTFIFLLIIATVIDRPSRLHALIFVIVISIGYWGVVSMVQTVASLGHASLTGPPGSMIGDNNQLAVALVMVLPLAEYCRNVSESKLVRNVCSGLLICLIVAILGTYSRGGLIALVAALIIFWWKSKSRLLATSIIGILIGLVVMLPQEWNERMQTIQTYQEDNSFQGRLWAWKTAIRIGLDRPVVGAGYRATEDPAIYRHYKAEGDPTPLRAVHDAYLQVLADHGFVGLGLFALMFFFAFRNCRWVVKRCSNTPDLYWLAYLARMMQVGFVGYAVGAMALSVPYYDLFLVLIVLSSVIRDYAQREATALEDASQELTPQRIPATVPLYARRSVQFRSAELGSDAGR
jgi:probable O-glycosylation ligase (exosortase A-associated)